MSSQTSCFKIISGCMEPVLPLNSSVIVRHAGAHDLKAGDIAAFKTRRTSASGSDIVEVHWVTGRFRFSEKTYFLHSANNAPSLGIFSADELIGKVILLKNESLLTAADCRLSLRMKIFSLLLSPVCAISAVFARKPKKSGRIFLKILRFTQLLFFLPFSHKKGTVL
ncbi:MAG: S24/S26 family peptidase [Planctomycetes bacterium]|nr:S24/S26 family peptidase [Planctomycetota bacterium]